jgi:AraC-like DNA-binding protein
MIALSSRYAERHGNDVPQDYVGYFCPTARPVLLLVTDHHAPGQSSLVHSHPCLAFHGCLQGPISLLLSKERRTLDSGTFYLFAPGMPHQWHNEGPGHAVMLSFLIDGERTVGWPAAAGVGRGCQELRERVQGAQRFEARGDPALQQAFWQLADCLQPDQPREPLLVTGAVWTLLGLLLERLRSSALGATEHLDAAQAIRRLLVQRVQDRLTVAEVARAVHLSSSRAKEVFHATFGCGIMTFFNRLKIQQAKRLLGDRSLTIKQVSQRLGFSSPTYFDRVFFRQTGLLPRAFRER